MREAARIPDRQRLLVLCLVLDGGVLDHPVGSLADALVAAQGGNLGACLDLFHRLFSLFSALSQLLVDLLIGGQQVLLLCDLQQCHAGAGVLLCGGTHLGSKALAGLVDLAQIAVQGHALQLHLLLQSHYHR